MTEKLAKQGWMVRVQTTQAAAQPAVMHFAVGKNSSHDAMTAVLERIELGDEITSTDRLTATEIWSYRLKPDEVRTYGKRSQGPL